jgi:hypothetical protein
MRYCCIISQEGLRRITKNISQDSWSRSRDSKSGRPEYEIGLLPT